MIFPVSLREKHKKSQLGTFYKIPVLCKTVKVTKTKKKSVKSHSQEEPKEDTSQISRMWDPWVKPGCAPRTEKGHWVKTKEIWIGLP